MDWRRTRVSADRTHHLLDEQPLYAARYREVLEFHAPGLAPAVGEDGAMHVGVDGLPAYAPRFRRTFGFYEGRAAVHADDGWHHVLPSGEALTAERFAWCGNFQGGRCAVRDHDGRYLHLRLDGRAAYADRWRYAGDYRDGIAVVQRDDGLHTHVDELGDLVHGQWFIDLDVFHKGFARARDVAGWTHVDAGGEPVYARRFAAAEPFYNGHARVERFDGGLEVIDEAGETVLELRAARETPLQRLSGLMVGFWSTQAIRAAVELGVFDALPGTTAEVAAACSLQAPTTERLLRALWELELVAPRHGAWIPTETGALLRRAARTGMPEAALHWATEHYRAWEALPEALATGRCGFEAQHGQEFFPWLSERPEKLCRYQAAMRGYAEHDYRGLHAHIDFAGAEEVIDAGGGTGALLVDLLSAMPHLHGTLLDLPSVTQTVRVPDELAERIRVCPADLLEAWAPLGDLIVLARVLHDWEDDRAIEILANARAALRPGGRVLLIEWILSDTTPSGGLLDLNMAVVCGSRERTLPQWSDLASAAGLRVNAVQRLPRYGSLMELVP